MNANLSPLYPHMCSLYEISLLVLLGIFLYLVVLVFMSENRVDPIQYGVKCILRNCDSEYKGELIELLGG